MKISGVVFAVSSMLASLVGLVWYQSPEHSSVRQVVARKDATVLASTAIPSASAALPDSHDPSADDETEDCADGEHDVCESESSEAREAAVEAHESPATPRDPTLRSDSVPSPARPPPVLTLLVRDSRGTPLAGALAVADYRSAAGEVRLASSADAHGLVELPAHIGATVSFEIRAAGHATTFAGPLQLDEVPTSAFGVTLRPGKRLTGVVSRDGQVVEVFDLVFWPRGNEGLASVRSLRSSAGAFTIDEIAAGAFSVAVVAADGACAIAEGDISRSLEIELQAPMSVRGVIEHAPDGTTVQACVASRGIALHAIGAARTVGADGRFEIEIAPRNGVVCVRAAGFAPTWIAIPADGDVGSVELDRRHALDLELALPEGEDPTRYRVSAWGIEDIALTRFAADGSVRLAEVAAGFYSFALSRDDGATQCIEHVLAPGGDWSIRLRVE